MKFTKRIYQSQFYLNFLFCALGCFVCLSLQKYFYLPNFLASACVGFAGSFLPQSKLYNHKQLIACIYTGSFSGMCVASLFSQKIDIILLCLLVGLYFNILSPYFKGIGGKLGSIGFLSSLSFLFIKRFL